MNEQKIVVGHVVDRLEELPDQSIHICTTSPPYYLARKYHTDPVVFGGRKDCSHVWESISITDPNCGGGRNPLQDSNKGSNLAKEGKRGFKTKVCSNCSGWEGELGNEPLADCLAWARGEKPCNICYVCHIRTIFAEVYRVLRYDGSLFLNLDDKMSGTGTGQKNTGKASYGSQDYVEGVPPTIPGLKRGDKCCVPERVALALQADGWILRSTIIWAKISPICESSSSYGWFWEPHRINIKKQKIVTEGKQAKEGKPGLNERYHKDEGKAKWILCPGCDECIPNEGLVLRKFSGRMTETYEFIFHLVKKMGYFWDTVNAQVPYSKTTLAQKGTQYNGKSRKNYEKHGANNASDTKRRIIDSLAGNGGRNLWNYYVGAGSLVDFWLVESEPLKDEHYAAYPTRIPRDCIKVATSDKGVCAECKSPYARVVERLGEEEIEGEGASVQGFKPIGWRRTCKCQTEDVVSSVVLDPFLGSGTTLLVAQELGRDGIGIERKQEYADIAVRRFKKANRTTFSYLDTVTEDKPVLIGSAKRQSLFGEDE